MTARLTDSQVVTVTSGAVLLGRYHHVLSEHEQELVAAVSRRFRDKGRDAMITANEWPVIEEAVGAMQAARREAAGIPDTAVGDAAGAPAVQPQPAAGETI